MKLQDLSIEQLKEIVDGAPDGAETWIEAIYTEGCASRAYYKVENCRVFVGCKKYGWEMIERPFASIGEMMSYWTTDGFSQEGIRSFNLSALRKRIKELEPEIVVGDKVVFIDTSCLPGDLLSVTEITEFEICLSNGMSLRHDLKWLRHATPAEITAGHRIDESQLDAQFVKQALGSTIYTQEYMNSLHPFDCEKCRQDAQATLERLYMIVCPDCGNKRCPQALNHRYKCTGSNAVNQAGELKEPDTITTQLDLAKCRVVDPALPYDEPAKRRVGWVGCLGFGAIGNALQGNQSNFDAMSEKHRSPSCKCHEFPIDAELKPDPFQQAKNKQQEEISQGKCGEFMAGYDRGFLTAWNERQDEIDSCEKIAQAVVQLEMQKNRQLQERINDLERRNRAFHEKNVDLERSCKMQHAEWSHMKQLLDKTLKGEQGE